MRAELPCALEGCKDTGLQYGFRKVEAPQLRTISPIGSSLSATSRCGLLALMIQVSRCQDESSGEANKIFSFICLANSPTQEERGGGAGCGCQGVSGPEGGTVHGPFRQIQGPAVSTVTSHITLLHSPSTLRCIVTFMFLIGCITEWTMTYHRE